ncbi:TetR/AcrR family transcriptional regulator [Nonomuraea sp. NPDC050310]|uniref:TetR/AcrR family transcriptional regulator n=1 Tax=unclassified Nonomuraea TaxID=2593643 RepID=UPI0033CC55F3
MRRVRANPGEGALLRGEILRVAEELLAETGTEQALTLRAVAARAGVSTPSVYLHFSGKEALIEAVCLRAWDELAESMRLARADDPFARLARRGQAYARFALAHPTQYRVLLMRPADHRAAQACFDLMLETVRDCVEAGVLTGEPEKLATRMWAAIHGCVSLLIAQPGFPWPEEIDDFVTNVVRMAGFGTAVAERLPRRGVLPTPRLGPALDAACRTLTDHDR